MERYAFKMRVLDGCVTEYKKRHDEIWPELISALKDAEISEYSIFFDEDTNILFGYLKRSKNHKMNDLPNLPIMKKWWEYMGDIMEINADNSPKSAVLSEVFYME